MSKGLSRFTFYTQKVQELINKARVQENPAMWLFASNARTPFFMLEALAKVYADMHNPKKFGKLKEHFKLIEDGLGKIDYYNSLSEAFSNNRQIPANCKKYIKNQLDISTAHLNEVLISNEWLSDDNKRMIKIGEKLEEAGWLSPEEEVEAVSEIYKSSIEEITDFVTETDFHFDNVELDVHELRRKLRWLSIYPQAFQGMIQYSSKNKTAPHLKKYLTKEIVDSPFNILPAPGNNDSFLYLHKNYFLALSWMISQLGVLKDEGLLLEGLIEALKHTVTFREDELISEAVKNLGGKQRRMPLILDDAEEITKTFFKEKNLLNLL